MNAGKALRGIIGLIYIHDLLAKLASLASCGRRRLANSTEPQSGARRLRDLLVVSQ